MALNFAGYLHLPNDLEVTPEVLGQSFDSVIDGIPFTIAFPTPPTDESVSHHLEPPFPSSRWDLTSSRGHDRANPWGMVGITIGSSDNTISVRSYKVAGLAFRAAPEDRPEDIHVAEVGARFNRLVSDWYRLAIQWFEIWTLQDLLGRQRHDSPEGQMWLDEESGPVQMLTGWRGPLTVSMYSQEHILTPHHLASGFAHASAGTLPPLEWSLYMSAIRNRDRRQAVIEAATAAEVAGQKAFSDKLGSDDVPEGVLKILIKQSNGLVGLTNVVRGLGVALPTQSQVQKRLGDVRNDAAHSGVVPTQEQLTAAFNVAYAVISAASPMPLP